MSCNAEFFGGGEMFSAFLCKIRLHSKTNKTSQEGADAVTDRQQSQGELSLLGRNVPRHGMGRLHDYHSRHKAKCETESDDNPDVRHEMVPRLKQKEDEMRHFQYCKDKNKRVFKT